MTTTAPRTLNGVNLETLGALVESVKGNWRNGLAGFHVVTRWTGGARSETAVSKWSIGGKTMPRAFTIRTDEPPELCGESTAPNPQEVLMAAMNACIMVGFVANCAVEGVELESFEMETEGELDLRGFLGLDPNTKAGYDEVRYTIRVKADARPELLHTIHRRVMQTSPNFFNVASPVRIVPTLVVD